jgi:hypothetical protein
MLNFFFQLLEKKKKRKCSICQQIVEFGCQNERVVKNFLRRKVMSNFFFIIIFKFFYKRQIP